MLEVQDVIPDDCYLDLNDKECGQHIYEFVIIPSLAPVVSLTDVSPYISSKLIKKAQQKRK